jgi:hypothetical protein
MDIDPPNGTSTTPTLPHGLITLNVSGERITAAKATLEESPYFRSLISRWQDGTWLYQTDGDTLV